MRHEGLFLLAATAIAVGVAVPAAPAVAQEPLPLDVTPTTGWVGRRITVSGQDCLSGAVRGSVNVLLFGEEDQLQFPVDEVSADGSWSVVITLPEGLAAGAYVLTAECDFPGSELDYAVVDFEVIDQAALDVTPTSGSVGSRVTVSGQDCLNGAVRGSVNVLLFGEEDQLQFPVDEVSADGSWSVVITLPEGLAAGAYVLTAECDFPGSELDYAVVDFEVVDATAPPPSTTTTTVGTPVPAPAPPAAPVPGKPTFTA
jgi:hypothetical protein